MPSKKSVSLTFTATLKVGLWWGPELIKNAKITLVDSKTKLQEYSLKKFKKLPIYKLLNNTGPRHKPSFKVAVKLKDTDFFEGSGSSIKKAQQDAAEKLLKKIKI